MPARSIRPLTRPFRVSITPPPSKSLAQRALILAALSDGTSTISNLGHDTDTTTLLNALTLLGARIDRSDDAATLTGPPDFAGESTIDVHDSGFGARSLTALAALSPHWITLDGTPRLRQRPMAELLAMLRAVGAEVDATDDALPVRIRGGNLRGGEVDVPPGLPSSQFLTGLLLIAPHLRDGLTLVLPGPIPSWPYVAMTLALMERFGAAVEVSPQRLRVEPGRYRPGEYAVEPDASGASYFLAAAALIPEAVCTIEGLGRASLQGDLAFADWLGSMGAGLTFGRDWLTVIGPNEPLRGIEVNAEDSPDIAPTLAVAAAFARGETIIHGIGRLRHKESDRVAAVQGLLTALGAQSEVFESPQGGESLAIEPRPGRSSGESPEEVLIRTFGDHRLAMAGAVAGAVRGGVSIDDAACVAKSFPDFWEQWGRLDET